MALIDVVKAGFARVADTVGKPVDWSAQLTSGLTAPQTLLAASKTVPGISRFATLPETLAGVNDVTALTPAMLAAAAPPSVTLYNNSGTNAPLYVRLATISGVDSSNGGNVEMLVSGLGGTGSPRANALLTVTQRGPNLIYPKVQWLSGDATSAIFHTKQISTYVYEIWLQLGNFTAPARVTLLASWNITGQICDLSQSSAPTGLVKVGPALETDWNFASGIQTWDSGFATDFRRKPGGFIHGRIGVKKTSGAAFAGGDVILTLGNTIRPDPSGANSANNPVVNGYSSSTGWTVGSIALTIDSGTGNLKLNGPPGNITGLFGSFDYPMNGA